MWLKQPLEKKPPTRTTRQAHWALDEEDDTNFERKRSEYYVKVLVVADRSMMQYHQSDEDLRHYILTLMSHVALLYKHASIGNSISLSVVNIWMLNTTVFTNPNSQGKKREKGGAVARRNRVS